MMAISTVEAKVWSDAQRNLMILCPSFPPQLWSGLVLSQEGISALVCCLGSTGILPSVQAVSANVTL